MRSGGGYQDAAAGRPASSWDDGVVEKLDGRSRRLKSTGWACEYSESAVEDVDSLGGLGNPLYPSIEDTER